MKHRPIELDDLFRIRLVSDVQIRSNGSTTAFVVTEWNLEKNTSRSRIHVGPVDGSGERPLTAAGHKDSSPRWSPIGSNLAFISNRKDDSDQLFLIDVEGGEAEPLTELPEGSIGEMVWSPDGTQIAFLFRETPDGWKKEDAEARKEHGGSLPVRVHTKLFYRLDAFGYFDNAFEQIWVIDVATKEARSITNETCMINSLTWDPSGKSLYFIANRDPDSDLYAYRDAIWSISLEGGEPTRVPAPDGYKTALSISPDGNTLAFVGAVDTEDAWGSRNTDLFVMPSAGSDTPLNITQQYDISIGYETLCDIHQVGGGSTVQWSSDGRFIWFPASIEGATRLASISPDGTGLNYHTPEEGEIGSFSLASDGKKVAFQLSSATEPHDVHLLDVGTGAIARLSNVNKELLTEFAFPEAESHKISNGQGGEVHTWVITPPNAQPGERFPAVLYVHGGPHAQYGGRSAPFHELSWLAANGYVVVFSNPRGSKGYGEEWTRAIKGDWGNRDWVDVQSVLDFMASRDDVIADKIATMGGSYGGFMSAWAVGHTDRLRCAIIDRMVANLPSMSGTCDFPWQHGKDWQGNAWENPEDLWRCSPLKFAANVNTPVLIIHSDGDLRCPISQSEEWFAALRMQGKPAEFVRYPSNSSHGMSRNGPPDLRADRLRRNLDFLDRHMKV